MGALGIMATAGAGVTQLIGTTSARAAQSTLPLPQSVLGPVPTVIQSAEPILNAMDPATAATIRAQMAATPSNYPGPLGCVQDSDDLQGMLRVCWMQKTLPG